MGTVYCKPSVISLLEVNNSILLQEALLSTTCYLSLTYLLVIVQTANLIVSHYTHIHVDITMLSNILQTRMDHETVWGTNIEMASLAHILRSPVYCYDPSQRYHIWAASFPNNVDRSIPRDTGQRSLYIYFANNHFQVVTTVRSR